MVDSENVGVYMPDTDFAEDSNEALVDLNLSDSTELWLLKLPVSNDLLSDIDGKELSLNLHNNGKVASFEDSSGKVYDFVSFASHEPDETVFVSSATEPKIAGKISKRFSVVHYPDPKELEKLNSTIAKQANQNSTGVTGTTSSRYFPMQSGNARSSRSSKGSRKSSLSEVTEPSDTANRRHMSESPRGHGTAISGMSSDHSHGGKSKKRKHKE